MKCKIHITGQINGNFELLKRLNSGDYKKGMFYSFYVYYNSVKEAKQSIKDAHRWFRIEGLCSKKARNSDTIYYDASQAKIIKE